MKTLIYLVILFASTSQAMGNTDVPQLLKHYSQSGALTFDAKRGEKLWNKQVEAKDGKMRDCNTCHGNNFHQSGKHIKSGKVIKPMALSKNPERYTSFKKVKKWFKRNCKWTFGRECTNQEKGDLLKFLSQF